MLIKPQMVYKSNHILTYDTAKNFIYKIGIHKSVARHIVMNWIH